MTAAPYPYVAAAHPGSEPRGDCVNGSPCLWCGQPVRYERAHTGAPMRWVHRDGTPRCTADIAALRRAVEHLDGRDPAPGSVQEGLIRLFDIHVALARNDLSLLSQAGVREAVDLARRILEAADIVVQDPCTGCGGQVSPSDYRSGCPLCLRCQNS